MSMQKRIHGRRQNKLRRWNKTACACFSSQSSKERRFQLPNSSFQISTNVFRLQPSALSMRTAETPSAHIGVSVELDSLEMRKSTVQVPAWYYEHICYSIILPKRTTVLWLGRNTWGQIEVTARLLNQIYSFCLSDIDECKLEGNSSVCHALADCSNTAGSFSCQCKKGYTGNGKQTVQV